MTDNELADGLVMAMALEQEVRTSLTASAGDLAERDRALVAYRNAVGLRQAFETWIAARAARAALMTTRGAHHASR